MLIGVTQRVSLLPGSGEKHDSLSQGWVKFLGAAGLPWVSLPNNKEDALGLAVRMHLTGIILTGGDNLGDYPERDETEIALLNWAHACNHPVVGICRGFQVMHQWLGGNIQPVSPELHVCQRHKVLFHCEKQRTVNSYHQYTLDKTVSRWTTLATCISDESIEAAQYKNFLGIMWHPEREEIPHTEDIKLVTNTLLRDKQ